MDQGWVETLEKGLKALFISVAVGGVALGGGAVLLANTVMSSDVEVDLDDTTKSAIDEGQVTPALICNELIKAQNAVADEMKERGNTMPVVIMSHGECVTKMAPK